MKKKNFPGIVGFECYPEGKLLQQVVDFGRAVGIAYERCIGYTKPKHNHDRVTISFARGASRSFIKTYPEGKNFRLDSSAVHWMAKDHFHEQGSYSAVYDTFALFPTIEEVKRLCSSLGLDREETNSVLASTGKLKRGAFVADALDRYFFHRVVSRTTDDVILSALEREILGELIMALAGRERKKLSKAPGADNEDGLARALEFIESNLFENIEVEQICAAARMSQATLFRKFQDALKQTPFNYIRGRRLDESMALLKTGNYLVGDAALLVGYEDLSAFSKAFKLRFRKSPSAVIPT